MSYKPVSGGARVPTKEGVHNTISGGDVPGGESARWRGVSNVTKALDAEMGEVEVGMNGSDEEEEGEGEEESEHRAGERSVCRGSRCNCWAGYL